MDSKKLGTWRQARPPGGAALPAALAASAHLQLIRRDQPAPEVWVPQQCINDDSGYLRQRMCSYASNPVLLVNYFERLLGIYGRSLRDFLGLRVWWIFERLLGITGVTNGMFANAFMKRGASSP